MQQTNRKYRLLQHYHNTKYVSAVRIRGIALCALILTLLRRFIKHLLTYLLTAPGKPATDCF